MMKLEAVLAVISKYANLHGRFHHSTEDTHCIVGGLAHEAGIDTGDINTVTSAGGAAVSAALTKQYGLSHDQLLAMELINDHYRDTQILARRGALTAQVRKWKKMEERVSKSKRALKVKAQVVEAQGVQRTLTLGG